MRSLARRTFPILLYAATLHPACAQEQSFPFIYSDPYFYLCDNELSRRVAVSPNRFVTATYTPAPDPAQPGIVIYEGTGLDQSFQDAAPLQDGLNNTPVQKPDSAVSPSMPPEMEQAPEQNKPSPREGKAARTAKEQLENIQKTDGWDILKPPNP